jgi:digeranylgeranylglycerophospholipid reductase
MPERVDVLVIGAGPAGALAARTAAQAGAQVLLVDQKRRMGSLPHCAEFVPRLLATELEFPARSRVQPVEGMVSRLGQESVFTAGPGWILDRQVFDAGLARAAAGSARVWAGCKLSGRRGEKWLLRRGADEVELTAGAVVAADGAASPTARALGLAALPLLAGVQVEAPLAEPLQRNQIYLRPEFRHGYAWLFPKTDTANLGLGCASRAGPRGLLENLRQELIASGIIKPGVLATSSGAIPVGGPRACLVSENVLFAGDAAGLTHPVSGAGIPQAVFSGNEAGTAAAALAGGNGEARDEYQEQIELRYGRYLGRGLTVRQEMEADWDNDDFTGLMHRIWPAWAGSQRGR